MFIRTSSYLLTVFVSFIDLSVQTENKMKLFVGFWFCVFSHSFLALKKALYSKWLKLSLFVQIWTGSSVVEEMPVQDMVVGSKLTRSWRFSYVSGNLVNKAASLTHTSTELLFFIITRVNSFNIDNFCIFCWEVTLFVVYVR